MILTQIETFQGLPAWRRAESLQDLCEITAQFAEGQLDRHPLSFTEQLDLVTLSEPIAAMNRAGFMTVRCQSGSASPHATRRAYVFGFASEEVARRIYDLTHVNDLIIQATPQGIEDGFHIPISLTNFKPTDWAGINRADQWARQLSAGAHSQLRRAWTIEVIDPRWGRNDYLWTKILEAISIPVVPVSSGCYRYVCAA